MTLFLMTLLPASDASERRVLAEDLDDCIPELGLVSDDHSSYGL